MKPIIRYFFKTVFMILNMALICFLFSGYNSGNLLQKSEIIKSIRVISNVPIILTNGKLENEMDSLDIYEFEKYLVFVIPNSILLYQRTVDSLGNISSNKLTGNQVRNKYLVQIKGEAYGNMYDSLNDTSGKKINIDTFLYQKGFWGCDFYTGFLMNTNDTLVQRTFPNDSEMMEKYITIHKKGDSFNDTTYLYFTTTLSNIDFSFCKQLDAAKKMKLYKSRFIFNQSINKKYAFPLLQRELWFTINKIKASNTLELISLININKTNIQSK